MFVANECHGAFSWLCDGDRRFVLQTGREYRIILSYRDSNRAETRVISSTGSSGQTDEDDSDDYLAI